MQKPRFEGASLKLLRANEHLDSFLRECAAYLSREPSEVVEERDAQHQTSRWTIRGLEAPPERLGLLLGVVPTKVVDTGEPPVTVKG